MIIFLYGEESYQSFLAVQHIKRNFAAKNGESEPIVFACSTECSVPKICQACSAQELFAREKLIIIEDFLAHTKAPEQKELIAFLQNPPSDTIVFVEKNNPRKNAALFTWLVKNADAVHEHKKLQGYALEKWIADTCAQNHYTIAPRAIKELVLYVGDNLWMLAHEIEKLGSYAHERTITVEDVQLLVHARVDADMFQTIEAIVSGNKGHALSLLKKQIAKGDDPFYIFHMYVYQLRTLLSVSGVAREERLSDKNAIAKKCKIHPFVAQKSLHMLKSISHQQLKNLYRQLVLIDRDTKNGTRTITDALDLFIMSV